MNHQCFLCRFNTHKDAIEMHQFIQEHVGTMHIDILSLEVHTELTNRKEPVMNDGGCEDISLEVIREHIASHTLNPVVRVGIMLRELFDLKDRAKGELHKVDANGQHMGLDPKMIESYLKIQVQILNVYRSEPSKFQFNSQQNATSGRDA
jgi:hypothetical protein